MLISEFLKNQISKIEQLIVSNQSDFTSALETALSKSLEYCIQLANIPNDELFRIMMEFYHDMTYYIMVTTKGKSIFLNTGDQDLINLQQNDFFLKNSVVRTKIFQAFSKK
jgi:hypothetical protein